MDNLTHTAVGLFLSRVGLKSWTPRATPILILAANIPDFDFLYATGGWLNYLRYHRHWTHSLAALPLMAILSVVIVRLAGAKTGELGEGMPRRNDRGPHPLAPRSDQCLRGSAAAAVFPAMASGLDQTHIFDLWITAICVLAIVGPLIASLVGSEISSGAAKERHHGRGFAWVALIFLLLYNGGRFVLHSRAIEVLDSRIYQEAQPVRVAAGPDGVNPFRWDGVVETADFWAVGRVDLLGDFDPTRATILHKAAPEPAIDVARATHTFQVFLQFSQFPLWRVTPVPEPENGRLVQVFDLRFSTTPSDGFSASAVVNSRGQAVEESLGFSARTRGK